MRIIIVRRDHKEVMYHNGIKVLEGEFLLPEDVASIFVEKNCIQVVDESNFQDICVLGKGHNTYYKGKLLRTSKGGYVSKWPYLEGEV